MARANLDDSLEEGAAGRDHPIAQPRAERGSIRRRSAAEQREDVADVLPEHQAGGVDGVVQRASPKRVASEDSLAASGIPGGQGPFAAQERQRLRP